MLQLTVDVSISASISHATYSLLLLLDFDKLATVHVYLECVLAAHVTQSNIIFTLLFFGLDSG